MPASKSKPGSAPSHYTFRNREGQTMQLRGDLTMEDLVRMGYGAIRLVQPEKPIAPHEWRADPIPPLCESSDSTTSRMPAITNDLPGG